MARHAIIIGVGGTGQYVVTLVKKELMEINNGSVPKNVRLLAFDTMPEAAAGGNKEMPENIISIGNVKLEPHVEFFPLSGNGWELGEQVIKDQLPHIGKRSARGQGYAWFDALEYRKHITPALWDLAAGAGRIRQFGRLSFFMKIDDVIRPRLETAFQTVRSELKNDEELEVILVSSFAGGTGAGMFVDMGVLCRDIGKSIGNHMIIRGFFVLPRAFANPHAVDEESRHMMARSFAAWRELDRFMNLSPDYGAHQVSYKANNQLDIEVKARPFDVCYLVDSKSTNYSLETVSTEHGVFPAIANYISLILDEKSGPAYSQDTRNYLRSEGSNKPGYSAFRTHTIKVPIYYDLELSSLSFAKDFLERWLIPVRDGRKNITGLADNQNAEAPNTQGRDAVIPFLQAASQTQNAILNRLSVEEGSTNGSTLQNTYLLPHIAYIYGLRGNPSKLAQEKDTDAIGGYSTVGEDGSVSPVTYVGRLALLPSDANRTLIEVDGKLREPDAMAMKTEAGISIWDEVKPSDETGENPLYFLDRSRDPVEGIEAFERRHLGAGAGNAGKFGAALAEARKFQVKRFRELLKVWMLNSLNGTQMNPRIGVSGKLGYVADFCNELIKALDNFREYLDDVKTKRDNQSLMSGALEEEEYTRQEMELWAGRKCAFFFTHPRAYVKQHHYLLAVDSRLRVRKDDMLLDTLNLVTADLLVEARKAQEMVQQWVDALALGGGKTIGLLRQVIKQKDTASASLAQERLDEATQTMTPEARYILDEAKITEQLRRISWDVDAERGFEIACKVQVPVEEVDNNAVATVVDHTQLLAAGDNQIDLDKNLSLFMTIFRHVYRDMRDERRVLDEVMKMNQYAQPVALANDLVAHSDVLVDLSANADKQRHARQAFLRVMDPAKAKSSEATKYLDAVQNQMIATLGIGENKGFRKLESQDEYKLTLLHTTYRIQDTDFSIWSTLRDMYLQHITSSKNIENAARLHVFPAECNAARYESRMPFLIHTGYRPLHPRVVMLLEHAERVSQFWRCLAYGFIKGVENKQTGERKYVFNLPKIGANFAQENYLLITNMDQFNNLVYPEWPSIFDVIHAFVMVGRDKTTNNEINWQNLTNAMLQWENSLRDKDEFEAKIRAQAEGENGQVVQLKQKRQQMRQEYLARHQNAPQGGWTWGEDGQEYEDLADLAKMMYQEALTNQSAEVVTTE